MTLRDYFAARAMAVLMQDTDVADGGEEIDAVAVAVLAYVYADEMLAARVL